MDIILASSSPRRRMMCSRLFPELRCISADIDETHFPDELPVPYTARMAAGKGLTAARMSGSPDAVIIASDTTVYYDGTIFGKPVSPDHAREILHTLNGREHLVCTAVSVIRGTRMLSCVCESAVQFRTMSDSEIDGFVASGVPMGKAGAYAIQDKTWHPVESILGCYACIVGLPLCHLAEMFARLGAEIPAVRESCADCFDIHCDFRPCPEIMETSLTRML